MPTEIVIIPLVQAAMVGGGGVRVPLTPRGRALLRTHLSVRGMKVQVSAWTAGLGDFGCNHASRSLTWLGDAGQLNVERLGIQSAPADAATVSSSISPGKQRSRAFFSFLLSSGDHNLSVSTHPVSSHILILTQHTPKPSTMVEPVGTTLGAVSLAAALPGVFVSVVQRFEYVELGRRVDKDFNKSQARLAALKLQITRWGISTGVFPDPQSGLHRAVEVQPEIVVVAV